MIDYTYYALLLVIFVLSFGAYFLLRKRLNYSQTLVLMITGIVMGSIRFGNDFLINIPDNLLYSIAVLSVVIYLFNFATRINIKQFEIHFPESFRMSFIFLGTSLVFLSALAYFIFGIRSVMLCLIFASAVSGTFLTRQIKEQMDHVEKKRIVKILDHEAVLSTIIAFVVSFIFIDFVINVDYSEMFQDFLLASVPFLRSILVGAGIGFIIAVISFRFIRKIEHNAFPPVILFFLAVAIFIVSFFLGGNYVIGIAVFGLFFANAHIKDKKYFYDHSDFVSKIFEFALPLFAGIYIRSYLNFSFILKSSFIFFLFLVLRYFSISLILKKKRLDFGKKLYLTLCPEISMAAPAVALFILSTFLQTEWLTKTASVILLFVLFSSIISEAVKRIEAKFLG
ncbi:MAG: hypothetical protein ACLFPQ_00465 [Candidatus Woesearchaeota archaeon]